jgi:deferrochelatase/peroxidase EfeB
MESTQPQPFQIVPRLKRRDILIGMAAAGGMAALAKFSLTRVAETMMNPAQDSVPFYGIHQAGILTPAPAAALLVAFDVTAKTRADLVRLLQSLSDRIAFLMAGGTPQPLDPKFPPTDSGILGPQIHPDALTITVAVGASLFDQRFGLSPLKPIHLIDMQQFPNDQLDPTLCHGDLLLQFCANTEETVLHALRDIVKQTPDALTLRWKMNGFLPPDTHKRLGKDTARNMLGFKDGTANLDVNDNPLMNRVVWVQPNTGEPSWTVNGSYQVVRLIRNRVEFWDRTPLQEQETIMGRHKDSGAPLGLKNEHDIPNYNQDPKGQEIPLDAHIRLANPRRSEFGLILRRGFNYSRGIDNAGQLDMGLLFVCFQSDLERGFVTTQNRLNGEPLEEYITPIGGGYFFTLPGVTQRSQYLGQALLEAA